MMYNLGMILAVDVGGTKTLLALFDKSGQILQHKRFATGKKYVDFIDQLKSNSAELGSGQSVSTVVCALPGELDRKHGVGLVFGNLAWRNVPIAHDLAKVFPDAKVLIENDAKLAALSEALSHKKYKKALFLTISTGIGDGLTINGMIDANYNDSEAGQMVLEHDGKLQKWEDFASGRALKSKYGKLASEIDDERIWYKFTEGLAQGIDVLVAAFHPDVIIIGGGVGAHFDKFGHFLIHNLKKYENKMVKMPPIVAAKRPEEAVIYGCYELAKQAS